VGRRFVDVRWIEKRMKRKDERVNKALAQLRKGAADMDRLALAPIPASTAPAVTADELELIRKTIAKDATPEELKLFLYDNARQGVHPLDKLIHFTKRGREGRYTPITSIDFMRIRAADSGECIGSDDATFAGTPMTASFEAHVTVYRLVQGQRAPFTATARWTEYKPDQDFMWKRMPHLMLAKCAEALALRKAFPKQLHGLYVKEEMEQAENKPRAALSKSLTASPGPAVTDAVIADPGLGVSATPANLNTPIPDAWQPFVQKTAVTGTIAAGTRSKTTGKTTLTITTDHGGLVQCHTTDHDVARAITRYKEANTPVTVTLLDNGEIVTLAEASDAAF
jgi:phage recombination protein Bet